MYTFVFTKLTQKLWSKLDNTVQTRIVEKLKYLKTVENINLYLKVIKGSQEATHRARVGDYRIILKREGNTFYMIDIDKRKDVYK